MKEGIHPQYRDVVFQDMSCGFQFITRSTANTREKVTMPDGKEYPLIKLDVSSESHPFYTGAQQRVSEAGRVERFRQKFARGGVKTA
jgi:large subunit ribosomal protein L31